MKKQYEQKLQAQLDEWSAEIDKLKAKANNMEADAKIEYEREIEKLNSIKESLSDKLAEIKESGDDALEDINVGFHDAMNSLNNAFKLAASRLK